MRPINIILHTQTFFTVNEEDFILFSKYECLDENKIIKKSDDEELALLVKKMFSSNLPISYGLAEGFFYNYRIPHISKEFDLLRFGAESIINIELKRTADEQTVHKQLIQNKHYLSPLEKKVISFTYLTENDKLFRLEGEQIKEVNVQELVFELENQILINIPNIDDLFDPSMYLISPFNSSESFINKEYFLTSHQEEVKKNIEDQLNNHQIFCVQGTAGTGKTLLLYDIAREMPDILQCDWREVAIVHCGNLNSGHGELMQHGFNIYSVKTFFRDFPNNALKFVIFDETQRLHLNQYKKLMKWLQETNKKCLFFFDPQQTLSNGEKLNEIPERIKSIEGVFKRTLTKKIRVNKELSDFILAVFDLRKINPNNVINNVEIVHFNSHKAADKFIRYKTKKQDYSFINYTPSRFSTSSFETLSNQKGNSHSVIGQEFDNVLVIIDRTFHYNEEQKLVSDGWRSVPYAPTMMLFQAVTRVRKKLCLVVINNKDVFGKCFEIIKRY